MHRRTVGLVILLAALVSATAYGLTMQILLMREHHAGVLPLNPGEAHTFSFYVFPVASEVRFSFVVESGVPADVVIEATSDGGTYIETRTPLHGSNGLTPGTYTVTISNRDPQSLSVVRYDVTSTGFPGGSVGAAMHSAFVVVAVAAICVGLGGLAQMLYVPRRLFQFCPHCGMQMRADEPACSRCGLPRLPVGSREGDAR